MKEYILLAVTIASLLLAFAAINASRRQKEALKQENYALHLRIEDMEEVICPNGAHHWVKVGSYSFCPCGVESWTNVYQYRCSRCRKRIESGLPFPPRTEDRRTKPHE